MNPIAVELTNLIQEAREARTLAGGMLADCIVDGVPVAELGDLIAEYKNAVKQVMDAEKLFTDYTRTIA